MKKGGWSFVMLVLGVMLGSVVCRADSNSDLMEAIRAKNISKAKEAITNGADVHARDKNGSTPLHFAAFYNATEIANLLIDKGADVNAKGIFRFGSTPLIVSSTMGSVDVARILLEKGADINARSRSGETALMRAAFNGKADMVRLLLNRGADVNAKLTEYGTTALLSAAERGDADVVRLLLEKGADVNAKDNDGKTALMAANEIIEKGNFGAVGKDGKMRREPLTPAEKEKYEEIVRLLKSGGAK